MMWQNLNCHMHRRLHMQCYHYRDNMQSLWLHCNVGLLACIFSDNLTSAILFDYSVFTERKLILIGPFQNSEWNASIMKKLKMMKSLKYKQELTEALIITICLTRSVNPHVKQKKRIAYGYFHSLEMFLTLLYLIASTRVTKCFQAIWCDFAASFYCVKYISL